MDTSGWTHETRLRVRGYELDSYRHVNHAVYLSYLEHARWELLAGAGWTLDELDRIKRWPVVVHLEIRYRKSALMDDELLILSRVPHVGRATFDVEHEIRRNGELLIEARIRAAVIDEMGRPSRIPDEFKSLRIQSEKSGAES